MKVENFPIYRKIFLFFLFIGKFSTRANILKKNCPYFKKLVNWIFFRFELEKFPPSAFQQFLQFLGVGAGAGAGAGRQHLRIELHRIELKQVIRYVWKKVIRGITTQDLLGMKSFRNNKKSLKQLQKL